MKKSDLNLPAPRISESCIKIKINLNFYFHTFIFKLKLDLTWILRGQTTFCKYLKVGTSTSKIGFSHENVPCPTLH